MTQFEETTVKTIAIACPACGGGKVAKVGKQNNQQRYRCSACKKDFRANNKGQSRRMDADLMGSAIQDYYSGKSYKQIAEGLEKEYNIPEPSKATVFEWVKTYTDEAVKGMANHKAKTGDHWVADEMVVDVGGKKAYNWNVMDEDTRYILASHLSYRRDGHAARAAIRKAAQAADKPPKKITTDKWRAYIKPIKDILPEAEHVQSQGIRAEINNNLSERLQGTFRDRTKTLRGLGSIKSGQSYLDGWTLNYNLFRKHHSLGNKTPGERAHVAPPFREWADVVKADAASPKVATTTETRRAARPKSPQRKQPTASKPRPATPAPRGQGQTRKRKHRAPKPVFPKVSAGNQGRKPAPPWIRMRRPRLPGRN